MKSQVDKYDGKDKRKTQGYLDEISKQNLRKKEHNISRLLDNYYWPRLHNRAWFPNGKYIVKKGYYHEEFGLGYNFEMGNVEKLKNVYEENKEAKHKIRKDYIEYTYLKQNQYTVTIEYCANCEEHMIHTHHSAELYKNFALKIQKCIMLRFPFINVLLKPIDTDIVQKVKFKNKPEKNGKEITGMPLINTKFKDVRIGAMEIQISCKKKNSDEIDTAMIHSKLKTKQWPKIQNVLDKIVSFLPSFNGQICLYEKEDNDEDSDSVHNNNNNNNLDNNLNNNNSNDNLEEEKNINNDLQNNLPNNNNLFSDTDSPLKNIQVNIYLFNNQKILDTIEEANITIENETDMKKRTQMMKERKLEEKSNNMFRPGTATLTRGNSATTVFRPSSSKTFTPYNSYNLNSYHTRLQSPQNLNNTFRGTGDTNRFNSFNSQNMINDKSVASKFKGKLLMTKYTDNDGIVNFGPLPYDSYFIEVVESNQYQFSGMILSFNKIEPPQNIIIRYIGLNIQDNAFLRVHVFETVKDKGGLDDQVHIIGSKVTLKTCKDDNFNDDLNAKDGSETKIEIDEVNNNGIYEHMVKPGRYLLEVTKPNYEVVRKFIDLKQGMNSINIEMFKERNILLKIVVYNYQKYLTANANHNDFNVNNKFDINNNNNDDNSNSSEPIKNAEVTIYQNSRDVLYEGITNKKGETSYLISKNEDFLSIVVNKNGYFPAQRSFIRSKSEEIKESGGVNNSKGDYIETFVVLLVKEKFIYEEGYTAIITYGCSYDDNLEIDLQLHSSEENNISIDICDQQKTNCILSTLIKYTPPEDKTLTHSEEEHDNKPSNSFEEENEYEEILELSYLIKSEQLLESNYQDKGCSMNGLERYSYETLIYNPKNMFYIPAPKVCDIQYNYWTLGWIDIKNNLFYETSVLLENKIDRILYFEEFIEFLQKIINEKLYSKLFKYFGFDKGALINVDRFIFPEVMKKKILELNFTDKDDIISLFTDMFKFSNQMISYNILKKKISSNLKNFKEEIELNVSKAISTNRSKAEITANKTATKTTQKNTLFNNNMGNEGFDNFGDDN